MCSSDLGNALGKTVIAEGIETPEQLDQLRVMGCQFGQGYLLARLQMGQRSDHRKNRFIRQ